MFQAWKERDIETARALQTRLTTVRHALQRYPFIPGLKQIMTDATGQAEWRYMRPPHVLLQDEDTLGLKQILQYVPYNVLEHPQCFCKF